MDMPNTSERYLMGAICDSLQKKMFFIGGPRQVGKTTLALQLLGPEANETHSGYLNWDRPEMAANLRRGILPQKQPIIILDEIHKFARWRGLVKGLYDTEKSFRRIVVTGSARLDYYRKGGESLANRYRYFRLHPFSLRELNSSPTAAHVDQLLKFGGFPEPLFAQDERMHRIWQRDRIARVVKEDLRDLEYVREISLIEQLVDLLPGRVGSVLSVNSLREDLQVDHKSVERWITILENLYYCFRILPFGSPKIRAVKKEKKLFLWDWSQVSDPGARFENLVASQLLKYCHFIEDTEGHVMELRFLRDTDKREVDFVVLKDSKPLFAVECKSGEKQMSPHLSYFSERTKIPKFYQVHRGQANYARGNISVMPFTQFCNDLNLP